MDPRIQNEIATGLMLVQIGLATAEQIKAYFSTQGHDDETLAAIHAEVDRRLARRGGE